MQITAAAQKRGSTRDTGDPSRALSAFRAVFDPFIFLDTPPRILFCLGPATPLSRVHSNVRDNVGVWGMVIIFFEIRVREKRERERVRQRRREMGSIATEKHSLSASVSGQVRSSRLQIPHARMHTYAHRAPG